jgi:hypothetical protein
LKKGPSGFTVGKDLGLHRKSIWLFWSVPGFCIRRLVAQKYHFLKKRRAQPGET